MTFNNAGQNGLECKNTTFLLISCDKLRYSYIIVCFVLLHTQVNIWVPQPEKQLDVIKVTGLAANVERAKQGLLERVKELQAEQEDRVNTCIFNYKTESLVLSLEMLQI